jgi:esterase/lipase superfamily enzyme
MIIVVSNRNIQGVNPRSKKLEVGDEKLFGDNFNAEGGPNELRVATAEKNQSGGGWKLTLQPDITKQDGSTATQNLFEKLLKQIRDGKPGVAGNWVVFIHGFNQSLAKNLKKCQEIADSGVNVIAFSWPSNPGPNGGFFKAVKNKRQEYRKARANARLSITAVDRFMERMVRYAHSAMNEKCTLSVNLLVHSLGNFLFQKTVEEQVYTSDLSIFDNIILHQADADNADHELWVDQLSDAKRVYVTINELDSVLKMSTIVNGRRLGNTAYGLNAGLPTYVDFSFGDSVGSSHRLFNPKLRRDNPVIDQFIHRLFNGKRAETIDGLIFNDATGAYQLNERPGETEFDPIA